MKNIGTIIYGDSVDLNQKKALEIILDYLSQDSEIQVSDIERYLYAKVYPNFLYIEKLEDENEISIDESRRIIEFLSQKPSIKGNRAVMIHNADHMSRNASNSLLKILEEPPSDAIIVLTTNKLLSLLPTIRSRCLKIRNLTQKNITFENVSDYIVSLIENIDKDFLEKSLNFIRNGCKNATEFAKQYSENAFEFVEIASLAYSYSASKDQNNSSAKKAIRLQNLLNFSKNTYPDKQSLILAAVIEMKD